MKNHKPNRSLMLAAIAATAISVHPGHVLAGTEPSKKTVVEEAPAEKGAPLPLHNI